MKLQVSNRAIVKYACERERTSARIDMSVSLSLRQPALKSLSKPGSDLFEPPLEPPAGAARPLTAKTGFEPLGERHEHAEGVGSQIQSRCAAWALSQTGCQL